MLVVALQISSAGSCQLPLGREEKKMRVGGENPPAQEAGLYLFPYVLFLF